MGNVINTGSFFKGLWPGVKKAFGDSYAQFPTEYTMVFNKEMSDKAYEEYQGVSPFGLAVAKNEGDKVTYDTSRQAFTTRLTNSTIGLGFQITMEAAEDNKFLPEAPKKAADLATSMRITKETIGGLVLTRAFSSTYLGGDGKELCATDHPNKAGGTYSNELATPADLSETAIEQLMTQIKTAKDDRGKTIMLMPECLIVSPDDEWEARRILESVLQNDTANNAINTLKGIFPKGLVVNRYYSAGNGAWFIKTNAPSGMIYQERKKLTFGRDNDADTFNMKFIAHERYTFGWGDPRGLYGSAGAA